MLKGSSGKVITRAQHDDLFERSYICRDIRFGLFCDWFLTYTGKCKDKSRINKISQQSFHITFPVRSGSGSYSIPSSFSQVSSKLSGRIDLMDFPGIPTHSECSEKQPQAVRFFYLPWETSI
jgi:hypothetical protein